MRSESKEKETKNTNLRTNSSFEYRNAKERTVIDTTLVLILLILQHLLRCIDAVSIHKKKQQI